MPHTTWHYDTIVRVPNPRVYGGRSPETFALTQTPLPIFTTTPMRLNCLSNISVTDRQFLAADYVMGHKYPTSI